MGPQEMLLIPRTMPQVLPQPPMLVVSTLMFPRMPLTTTKSLVDHPTAPETTLTPSSQMSILYGTVSLIPTTTTPPELTVVPTESQFTIIQFTTMEPRSNSKPSMLTQRPSTVHTCTLLPHSPTITTQPGNEQKMFN